MKKVLTAIILVLFLSSISYSQFKMKVGPTLGLNFNIGTGSDLDETVTGLGMIIGAQVDMNFTPMVGLITNLQFYDNRSGSSSTEGTVQGGTSYTLTNSTSLAYFMIEPLFKLSIPRSGFYFVMGPMIGFNIEATFEQNITSRNNDVTFQGGGTKNKQSLKNTLVRFGLKTGAGIDINLSRLIDLTPQLNFEYGLTNVQSDFSSRILTFQALVTVKFKVL
ncbi:MAG: outer membrane beta-barrel protein [Melioribacteraceae bacterium]